jgi:hypothetical protein
MLAVEAAAAGRAYYERTVGDRFADRAVALRFTEYVPTVNCHRSGPEAARARRPHDGELPRSHVLHGASDGADVTRAARANQDDAQVFQHWNLPNGLNVLNELNDWNNARRTFKPFKKFKRFKSSKN